ncbi:MULTISPECIES: hypothetical protein [Roseomonadaceae]|uniref:UrcA family protein n=1 Tax=Falsiroseomonas oleicola TaxID=2801474 RepID=A0ABS6H555_9PROT|nr:hypothetical protein [Roseomonas oleicola]MBU8543817.1 hypothetical protein [Roseomonas oleicola]
MALPRRAVARCGTMAGMRAFLALWLPILLAGSAAAQSDQPKAPLRVTTDSVGYCRALAARMAELAPRAEADRRLLAEGRQLCDDGHPRAGIAKLRRALRGAQAPR